MNIAKVSLNFINTRNNIRNQKTKAADAKPLFSKSESSYSKIYGAYFTPVYFGNSQKKPLTNEDYNRAKEYWQAHSNLNNVDFEKLNGIQKGIKVFEGLSMEDIDYAIFNPGFNIALNRGCKNYCAHCYCSATPITNKTLDKMSYENFKSLSEGLKELRKRLNSSGSCKINGLFFDSDCIDIEISDKEGNIYDYTDCLKEIGDISAMYPLFDTSGWDPDIEKYQKRAEKFVNFMLQPENRNVKGGINISINPYHSLYVKSVELKKAGKTALAQELEEKYIKRMANALFTFTPLNRGNLNIIARAIPHEQTNTGLDDIALEDLENKIFNRLEKMYIEDFNGEQKYVKDEDNIKYFVWYYKNRLKRSNNEIEPFGRAQNLFIAPDNFEESVEYFKRTLEEDPRIPERVVNPNGKIVVAMNGISTKTDLQFNFEDSDKPSKPLAYQIEY